MVAEICLAAQTVVLRDLDCISPPQLRLHRRSGERVGSRGEASGVLLSAGEPEASHTTALESCITSHLEHLLTPGCRRKASQMLGKSCLTLL